MEWDLSPEAAVRLRERASLWGPGLFYPLTPLCSSSASPTQSASVPYAAIYDSMQSINKHVYCTMQANYHYDITGALIITIQLPVNVTRWQELTVLKLRFNYNFFRVSFILISNYSAFSTVEQNVSRNKNMNCFWLHLDNLNNVALMKQTSWQLFDCVLLCKKFRKNTSSCSS